MPNAHIIKGPIPHAARLDDGDGRSSSRQSGIGSSEFLNTASETGCVAFQGHTAPAVQVTWYVYITLILIVR
jgi:hypothetical protein